MGKELITEQTIWELIDKGLKVLDISKSAIVTQLAAELAQSKGIKLVEKAEAPKGSHPQPAESGPTSALATPSLGRLIVFGSDHGGFQLKELLKKHADGLGFRVMDVGTHTEDPCDYPDFAYAVASLVSKGEAWRGVMIDGAGIGSCVVANKVPGIKAACCHNEFVARNAREHNDTNVLTLGSKVVGSEVCKDILRIWLEAWFSGGRHKQRIDKISDIESKFMK